MQPAQEMEEAFYFRFAKVTCCDPKEASKKFVTTKRAECCGHFMKNIGEVTACAGTCANFGGYCDFNDETASDGPGARSDEGFEDCTVWGTPCQPFTNQSHKAGQSPENHKDYPVTFGDENSFISHLETKKPKGAILEQVRGFMKIDPKTGESPLSKLLKRIKAIKGPAGSKWASHSYYEVKVQKSESTMWVLFNTRPRRGHPRQRPRHAHTLHRHISPTWART